MTQQYNELKPNNMFAYKSLKKNSHKNETFDLSCQILTSCPNFLSQLTNTTLTLQLQL